MIHLETLGGLAVTDPSGRELVGASAQPKRLALLAYLALAGPSGFVRRDPVAGLFWPESDQEHARGSLRQSLAFLRRALGEVIVTRGQEEIGVAHRFISCDALQFRESCASGRHREALSLYRGDFLAGLYLANASPELEHWMDDVRAELRRLACENAASLAAEERSAGNLREALAWARRASALAPHDETVLRALVQVHDALGDRAGALEAYDGFARRLASELEIEPSPETQHFIREIRARGLTPGPLRPVPPDEDRAVEGRDARPRKGLQGARVGGLIAAASVLLAAWLVTRQAAPSQPAEPGSPQPPPVAARNAFVRGQYHLGRRDTTSIRQARDEFARAIDEDPDYADAYASLAYTYGAMAHYGMMPSPDAFARVEAAARRALKLEPDHGLALAQLASVESFQRWDWPEGERLFRDALAAAPRDADVHNLFGIHLRVLGRYDEALYEMRQARMFEPITRHYAYQVAQVHLCAGFPDSALAEYRQSAELGVDPVASHLGAAEALGRLHRWDEALVEWATGLALAGDSATADKLRKARGRAGYEALRRAQNEDRLRRTLEAAARTYVPSTVIAAAHAAAGQTQEALRWLRRALSERDVDLIKIGCSRSFDPIRTDPEFRRIAAAVGVPPGGVGPE